MAFCDIDDAVFLRLVDKFLIGDGCWEWLGGRNANGYGQFHIKRFPHPAHRVTYEVFVGPIPDGLDLDHLCRNRACVRPDHLEPVTRRENTLRGETLPARNILKTHCPRGHPYDEINTRVNPRTGARFCRACDREKKSPHIWGGYEREVSSDGVL